MSIKTTILSRHNFLKGFVYTSALSLGGLSSLALGSSKTEDKDNILASEVCGVSVLQQKLPNKESVTLINQSNKSIILDALEPVRLERFNGSIVIKPNQLHSNVLAGIEVSPSQRITIDIQATGANIPNTGLIPFPSHASHLQVTSEHSAFNYIAPVQVA